MILLQNFKGVQLAYGVWTSNEFSGSGAQGDIMGQVSAYSDQAGQLAIYQADESGNPNLVVPSVDGAIITPLQMTILRIPIKHLFWWVVVSNGGVQQNIFNIAITASVGLQLAILEELQNLRSDQQTPVQKTVAPFALP